MNKYGILSRGSGNSYLQHSINSNLISAKTSTSGKFAILFNREMAILKFLFALADFKYAIFWDMIFFLDDSFGRQPISFACESESGNLRPAIRCCFLPLRVGDCQKFFLHHFLNWSSSLDHLQLSKWGA